MSSRKTDLLIIIFDFHALSNGEIALDAMNSLILDRAMNSPSSSILFCYQVVLRLNESPDYYKHIRVFGDNPIISCSNVMPSLVQFNKEIKQIHQSKNYLRFNSLS